VRAGLALGFPGELPGVGHLGGPAVLVGPLLLLAGLLGRLVRVLIGLGELPVLGGEVAGVTGDLLFQVGALPLLACDLPLLGAEGARARRLGNAVLDPTDLLAQPRQPPGLIRPALLQLGDLVA
jgi:hypothetical protein